MNTNSYLNPQSMRQQCSDAIADLSRDNNIYREISKRIDEFVGDSRFKSTGVDALKAHLSDYQFVIRAMIAANEYDIYDLNVLMNSVGYETLVGSDILYGKETSRGLKQENEQRAYEYEQKAADALLPIQEIYYKQKANNYRYMADLANQMFNRYVEKENEYHRIDNETRNLFGTSDALRQSAKNGLASLSTVFLGGTYVVSQTAPWKQEIMQSYADIFYSTDASGKLIPNWDGIEKCLKKDAGDITKEEYDSLALVYMNLEANELGRFLNLCMDKGEDVRVMPSLNLGVGTNVIGKNYTEWFVDEEKIDNIFDRLRWKSDCLLRELMEIDDERENAKVTGKRNDVLQKMTLLHVIEDIGKFRSTYQSKTSEITTELNDENGIIIKFHEERIDGDIEYDYMQTLGKSSITIASTEVGNNIASTEIEEDKKDVENYLGIYSFAGEMVDMTADKAESFVMDELVLGNLFDESMLGTTIGNSTLGSITDITVDIVQSYAENRKNERFVEALFDRAEAANIYANYDCSVNYVMYNTADKNGTMLYVYEGEDTVEKIQRVNELLNYPLTKEEVLYNPQKVWDEVQELKKDKDWAMLYEQIICNR